jgi:dolichol-phosphate mannosyltransferase
MDGDYTYDPADIERFLQHANGYDEIVGSRLTANIGWLHKLGNRIISTLFNDLFGSSISDVCSGMYLMNLNSAKQLHLRTTGFSVEVEILAQMAMNGRVTEVPINYRRRMGRAKLNTWLHGFDIVKSVLLLARVYNPVFLFSLIATSAVIPALAILLWVLWGWVAGSGFQIGWAMAGAIFLMISSFGFALGTIAVLLKRTEIRIERLVKGT